MYTVKHAAALTGIPAATLRMWERRYDVVRPERSASGYRMYDEAALQRLVAMQALVVSGWSPREAAAQVKATSSDDPGEGPAEPGGEATETGTGSGDVEALARMARDFDPEALTRAIDDAFAGAEFDEVVSHWLMPALRRLGAAWQRGQVTVAGEHFVSATVQRRLAHEFEATAVPAGAPRVLVGLARGSRHELGVLAFATSLRRAGLDVVYLGGDVPPEGWVVSASGSTAAVVLGVPSADDVIAVREAVAALAGGRPELPVFVGGGHQELVGQGVACLGHDLGAAARAVVGAVATPPSAPGSR
jgi:DNA-binding transcriptional MerR regulator/methylmalonyl-CoA mutase cobalamin-binding subunit